MQLHLNKASSINADAACEQSADLYRRVGFVPPQPSHTL